jgi:hypothetical protein
VSQKAIEKRMSKALKKMKDVLHPNVDWGAGVKGDERVVIV